MLQSQIDNLTSDSSANEEAILKAKEEMTKGRQVYVEQLEARITDEQKKV